MLIALTATAASAATYTFDLQKVDTYHSTKGDSGEILGNTLTITETGESGGLTGTFTGKYIVDATYTDDALAGDVNDATSVQRHNNGLGVCNVGPCSPLGDTHHTIDGASVTADDLLITDFVEMAFFSDSGAVDVTLQSLTFGWVGDIYGQYPDTNGMFEILVSELSETMIDLGALLAFSGEAVAEPGSVGGRGSILLPELAAFTDNLFGIKAGIEGSWKLMAATVDYSVPEIPLPAAGWLLLGGLGGLAALRRAKKRA